MSIVIFLICLITDKFIESTEDFRLFVDSCATLLCTKQFFCLLILIIARNAKITNIWIIFMHNECVHCFVHDPRMNFFLLNSIIVIWELIFIYLLRPSGPVAQRIEAVSLFGSRWALPEDSGFKSYPSRPEVYLVKNMVR